jgi:hypothetical protein
MKGRYVIMTEKIVKVIGVAATVVSLGATVASGWVGDKKMELAVEKKVAEALTKRNG